jgi:hypothetical protein
MKKKKKKKQTQTNNISWAEVSSMENILFGIFAGKKRNMWFQKAWQAMEKAGLTFYNDYAGRQRSLLCLMTVATLYYEFCELAFRVPFFREGEVFEWIQQGAINRLHIWGLINARGVYTKVVFDDLDYCLVFHTCKLIDGMRNEVFNALQQFYHNSNYAIFMDMFKTGYDPNKESVVEWDEVEYEYEDFGELAFSWIIAGMPRSTKNPNN